MAKGTGTVKSHKIIKFIKAQLKLIKDDLKHDLSLYTDNGVEFTSKEYSAFVNNNESLVGSTPSKGKPTDNTVIERWNRLFI